MAFVWHWLQLVRRTWIACVESESAAQAPAVVRAASARLRISKIKNLRMRALFYPNILLCRACPKPKYPWRRLLFGAKKPDHPISYLATRSDCQPRKWRLQRQFFRLGARG